MRLSPEETAFLRHWIYDEAHYRDGQGPAKRLQVQQQAPPADLAVLIAAGMPDLEDQEAASSGPPPVQPPSWPWSAETLRIRVQQARSALAEANPAPRRVPSTSP